MNIMIGVSCQNKKRTTFNCARAKKKIPYIFDIKLSVADLGCGQKILHMRNFLVPRGSSDGSSRLIKLV